MRLLVTRPQEDAERTAQALRARGHEALLAPLLRIEPVDADLAGDWTGVLMTSANAARALEGRAPELRSVPVLTVGDRTAEAARESGFTAVTSAGGALGDLVALAAATMRGNNAQLLYLAGRHRSGDLANELVRHGIAVRTAIPCLTSSTGLSTTHDVAPTRC